jgi:hypothetical protein
LHHRQQRFGLGRHFSRASERLFDRFNGNDRAPPKFHKIPEESSDTDEHDPILMKRSTAPTYSPMSDITEEVI